MGGRKGAVAFLGGGAVGGPSLGDSAQVEPHAHSKGDASSAGVGVHVATAGLCHAGCGAIGRDVVERAVVPGRQHGGVHGGVEAAARGVAHLQRNDPGLYATIEWARGHLDPARDVVVQAVSESYTTGNALSAAKPQDRSAA